MLFVIGLGLCSLVLISTSHCVDAYDQSFALCANQKGFIRCEKGSKIRIISAVYGRTDNKVCPYGKTNTRTCRSLTSEIKVRWSCNGYRTCHLHASNQIFGNPCINFSKYLEVTYGCVKDPNGKEPIAFNAYSTYDMRIDRNAHLNVVYNNVYSNHGNAYNPVNGIFTAPSPGLYVFTWTSCVPPKKMFDAEILVNGKRKGLGNCNNEGGSGNDNCSNTVPLVLETGDKVNIRTVVADYLFGGGWSSFKGWRVSSMYHRSIARKKIKVHLNLLLLVLTPKNLQVRYFINNWYVIYKFIAVKQYSTKCLIYLLKKVGAYM